MRASVVCPWVLAACNVACANSSGGNLGDASLGGRSASSQSGSSGSVGAEPDAAVDGGASGSSTASSSSSQGVFDAAVDSGDAAGVGPCDPSMTTPVVLQVPPDGGFYHGLAIDDAWVYFGQDNIGARRIAKTGGSVEDFVPGDASVAYVSLAPLTSPVVYGDDVYWVTDAEGVVRVARSSFTTASPAVVAPVPFPLEDDLRSIGIDGTNVYFGDIGDNVAIAPLGGGTPTVVLIHGDGFADSIVGDPAGVFFADDTSGVFAAGPGGSDPTLIAPGLAWGLALDNSYVYWTDILLGIRRIARTATDAGAATTIASTSATSNCLAIDDQFVYWGENVGADGGVSTLRDAPKDGGEVRILATGVAPTAITTDATCVYYLDGQHLMRVSKWAGTAP